MASNELEVEYVDNQEIQKRIEAKNIDMSFVLFAKKQPERALDNTDSSNNSGDAAATGTTTEYTNENAANIVQIMDPITQTMSTPTHDLDDKKKAKIKEKAEKSKEAKEREGIGE